MRWIFLVSISIFSLGVSAQNVPKSGASSLKKMEDSMKAYSRSIIMEKTALQRFTADSVFIRMLVRALKTPHSFDYPFDSLETISRIYSPDSTFRLFSWQFARDENYFRQRGAIQMKTADGSLKLYPLLDMSDFTTSPQDSTRTGQNWIGAIYYGIVMKTFNNKNYYTLLGYDDNNMRTTKKWIEVLSFDNQGRPVFGGPFFSMVSNEIKTSKGAARYCLEYKKEGKARLNYDPELDMIVYDHLISESNEPDKAYTLVPDGDYQGFKWVNGKWSQIDKVFDYKTPEGETPVPEPLKDASGNNNELKLMEQSEKNKLKMKQEATAPPVKKPAIKRQVEKKPAREHEESY